MRGAAGRWVRRAALGLLAAVFAVSLLAEWVSRYDYSEQSREEISASPSPLHPLGTDALGRDRMARLLHGARVSLLLAPSAAFISTLLAAAAGLGAVAAGGWVKRVVMAASDYFLAAPWLFLLLTVRALLPLNVEPGVSAGITFLLLGLLGWPAAARVVCAASEAVLASDWHMQARAMGIGRMRSASVHLLPAVRGVLLAQFTLLVPAYLLSEANLGLLGLGITEPLPSLGGLMREMESFSLVAEQPWVIAPALLLVMVVLSMGVVMRTDEAAQ